MSMILKNFQLYLTTVLVGFFSIALVAQDNNDLSNREKTVLHEGLWDSVRALSMGGALSTIADSLDAAHYNPANIGDLPGEKEKGKKQFVRHLYFPAVLGSANENTQQLNKDFADEGGATDVEVGEALVRAAEGKRQFGRFSLVPAFTLGRLMVAPYFDQQGAAVSLGNDTPTELEGHFQSQSGIGAGLSLPLYKNILSLGVFGYASSIKVYRGTYEYLSIIDTDARKDLLKDSTYKYDATGGHVGLNWRLPSELRPAIALVAQNVDGADVKLKSAPELASDEDTSYEIEENLTTGFSISPQLSKNIYLHVILEGHHLTNYTLSLEEKVRMGMELNLWGQGSNALFNFRAGYNFAGAAYGVGFNFGIFRIEYASFAEDVGAGNKKIIDRRTSALFAVDIAE